MHLVHSWARSKAYSPSIYISGNPETKSTPLDTSLTQGKFVQTNTSVAICGEDVLNSEKEVEKKNYAVRILQTCKSILFASYLNVLLVFVPAGIAAKFANLNAGIVFGLNAIAIVPLAGLLSHATESVAKRMGDTVGALMNVTFGNAVELIIFIIALRKDEIRIVQASLLGSILANLLLILGMCFLIGGLRYLEQLYNKKVTQLSACLLSLSVMSLLLPTAFHASFSNTQEGKATTAVLKVSRGTSVVLLLVYGMYLLFQLKSHVHIYKSTPQHLIDEEAVPGPVAAWIEHSSSNHSSSGSDSDGSYVSHFAATTRRMKKAVMRRSSRRNSSNGSTNPLVNSQHALQRRPSTSTLNFSPCYRESTITTNVEDVPTSLEDNHNLNSLANRRVSIVDSDDRHWRSHREAKQKDSKRKSIYTSSKKSRAMVNEFENALREKESKSELSVSPKSTQRETINAINSVEDSSGPKHPFHLRLITLPSIPKKFSQSIFTQPFHDPNGLKTGVSPDNSYGVRRTNSLPNNLNVLPLGNFRSLIPGNQPPINFKAVGVSPANLKEQENISRTTSVFLLLISTGLVALCAEFMVDRINAVVKQDSGLSEAFIGLIILPIVGNAAEHVTAVTVATKNKMDLAIGVAIGSSIQIALFVTPFVVLLGWCMGKKLSLLFTLFETVSLFVSAFIVNFLVLDGKSNYLEGALLCAAYIMIAVAAFFYPSVQESSSLGGNEASHKIFERAGELIAGFS